uniref:peptidase T n=1 Tax=Thaumasiovibrio occultus TaxID=1891184 RepID=UPI000B35A1BE|nr:peptidase T [Thaumasiovibrio occultus]
MENVVDRFVRYVQVNTQSDASQTCCPTTAGQMALAEIIKQELIAMELADVSLDENGYLMAKLPSNIAQPHTVPAIGFIAHLDTAPDASGENVKPQLVENYQGGDIALGVGDEVISPAHYPELHNLIGCNLITTDGTTLLGADNKAGVAEILTAIEGLKHSDVPHGDICIGFTPDEEIGRGADRFDVAKFGAQWAYTIDGGPVGELQFENFCAASAKIEFKGISVHPGTAKDKLINALNMACDFHSRIPRDEMPETSEGYEGFYHLNSQSGSITQAELRYILRDFSPEGLEARKAHIRTVADHIQMIYPKGVVTVSIDDSYMNMQVEVEKHPHIIELAKAAMTQADVEPRIVPIRGGTDGARLSFMGLPCPNVFTGGYNFHGIHEFITIEGMNKAVEVIQNIATATAKQYLK